jgi:hypothetical protein
MRHFAGILYDTKPKLFLSEGNFELIIVPSTPSGCRLVFAYAQRFLDRVKERHDLICFLFTSSGQLAVRVMQATCVSSGWVSRSQKVDTGALLLRSKHLCNNRDKAASPIVARILFRSRSTQNGGGPA